MIQIAEVPFLSQLDLRTTDPASLGLPTAPNTWTDVHGADALWLGPNEWLIVGALDPRSTAGWERAESIVDVGANRVVLDLSGTRARELLSKGCSLDLHPSSWASGTCAQTLLAKAPVILQQRGETTRIFVRPSFADYLVEWFLAACG